MKKHLIAAWLLLSSVTAFASEAWTYYEDKDAMTGKVTKQATLRSMNSLNLGFPYQGPNKGRAIIRRHPTYGLDVIVTVEKGQILCRSYENCRIRVRFGQQAPISFSGTESADHSSETIFLSPASKFINLAKTHKTFIVELPIYKEGNQILEFSTSFLLEWK